MSDLPPPPSEGMPPPPGGTPPPPGGMPPAGYGAPMNAKDAKANAKAAKAHAKAMRPWYKKKRFILGGILAIIVIAGIASGGGSDDKTTTSSTDKGSEQTDSGTDNGASDEGDTGGSDEGAASDVACKDAGPDDEVDTKNQDLYPDRPGVTEEEHQAALGDCVRLSGFTAFVEAAEIKDQEFGDPQTIVTVRVQNRDDSPQDFNMFDWSLQTPSGTVLDPTISLEDDSLDSGELVKGGEATGTIAFDASEPGTYFVVYTPDIFEEDARGIWQIEV